MHKIGVCIVGGGPAGFLMAEKLSNRIENVIINIIEREMLPFGLIRWGVSPDHPEIRNSMNVFRGVLSRPNVNYFGNITFGRDISLAHATNYHHILVFCTGMQDARPLKLPGSTLTRSFVTGLDFVRWYNCGRKHDISPFDLRSIKKVAIIGHGNVALDIARILLKPYITLSNSSISEVAFRDLRHSSVERVDLLGRRGPMQVSFTIPELRELLKLENLSVRCGRYEMIMAELSRSRGIWEKERRISRLVSLLEKRFEGDIEGQAKQKQLCFQFHQFPKSVLLDENNNVKALSIDEGVPEKTIFQTIQEILAAKSIKSEKVLERPYDLVINATGFISPPPIDETSGALGTRYFFCGWAGPHARGNLADTAANAQAVSQEIVNIIATLSEMSNIKDPSLFSQSLKTQGLRFIDKDAVFS